MDSYNTFAGLIPYPNHLNYAPGSLPVAKLKTFFMPEKLDRLADDLLARAAFFKIDLKRSSSKQASVVFRLEAALGSEAWNMDITGNSIRIQGGDDAGIFYAICSLTQIFAVATAEDLPEQAIRCGSIQDSPRFRWRGFMLDSARHFQSVEAIKSLIRHLAQYKLNVFHWHLTDSQGWRTPSKLLPRLAELGEMEHGSYTAGEIREVTGYAKQYFMRVVPELDMPGHSRGLLRIAPELTCSPVPGVRECCIGNPSVREFMKKLLLEFMKLFPESKIIHLGGDEAETTHWDQCPVCKQAMKKKRLSSARELENDFMLEMTRFVVEHGRTPMVWCTSSIYPADVIVQAWQQVSNTLPSLRAGNPIVDSLNGHFYFDYPAHDGERHPDWMRTLSRDSVYMSDPYCGWDAADRSSQYLGPEACLWTETVPERRLMQKILPRLGAFAETAWCQPERKSIDRFRDAVLLLENSACDAVLQPVRK